MEGVPTVNLPSPARWIAGRKAGSQVLLDPFNVRLKLKVTDPKNKFYWCSRTKDLQCLVRVTLDRETDCITRITGEHNHDSSLVKDTIMEKYQEIVQNAVSNPTITPRTAYMDLTAAVMGEPSTSGVGVPELPNQRSMARLIQKKRKAELGMPSLPSSWEEMTVPDEYYTTQDGGDFLILDEYVPGTLKKVWGWASDSGISVLKASSDIYGDGTFEVAKSTLFSQAWILVAKSEQMNVSIPCAFFLLPDKQYNSYSLCLNKVKELGVTSPKRFHLDFEAASIKAVKNVFGAATVLECCDTHWKRCLRTHQQEVGLVPHINNQVEVQTFCRKLWALSFVPQEDIVHVYTKVLLPTMPEFEADEDGDGGDDVNNYNKALDSYLHYFEGTWVGAESKRTKVRGKPKFSFDLWVKYQAVKDDRPDLTSNRSEAWNSASNISIP